MEKIIKEIIKERYSTYDYCCIRVEEMKKNENSITATISYVEGGFFFSFGKERIIKQEEITIWDIFELLYYLPR